MQISSKEKKTHQNSTHYTIELTYCVRRGFRWLVIFETWCGDLNLGSGICIRNIVNNSWDAGSSFFKQKINKWLKVSEPQQHQNLPTNITMLLIVTRNNLNHFHNICKDCFCIERILCLLLEIFIFTEIFAKHGSANANVYCVNSIISICFLQQMANPWNAWNVSYSLLRELPLVFAFAIQS